MRKCIYNRDRYYLTRTVFRKIILIYWTHSTNSFAINPRRPRRSKSLHRLYGAHLMYWELRHPTLTSAPAREHIPKVNGEKDDINNESRDRFIWIVRCIMDFSLRDCQTRSRTLSVTRGMRNAIRILIMSTEPLPLAASFVKSNKIRIK